MDANEKLEGVLSSLQTALGAPEREKEQVDQHYEALKSRPYPVSEATYATMVAGWDAERQARHNEIDKQHAERVGELRQRGYDLLGELREEAARQRDAERAALGPQTPEEWGAVGTMAGYIRDELQGLDNQAILKAFERAQANGDRLRAWTIAKEGKRILSQKAEPETAADGVISFSDSSRLAQKAAQDLESLAWGEVEDAYQAQMTQLGEVEQTMRGITSPWEWEQQVQAAAITFGVRLYDEPISDGPGFRPAA